MWGTDQTTGGSVSFHGGPSHLTLFVSHKLTQKKRANTHIRTLLGQVPQEIIIQLQNEDQKCHPLLLRSSSANPFLLGFCVFLHTSFLFFLHTFCTRPTTHASCFFCFLKCALFTCPLYSSAPPLLLTVSAFFFPAAFSPLFLISVFLSLLSIHNRWQSHPWLGLSLSLALTHAGWMKDFCHAVCFGEGCFKAAIFREREQARSGKEKDKGSRWKSKERWNESAGKQRMRWVQRGAELGRWCTWHSWRWWCWEGCVCVCVCVCVLVRFYLHCRDQMSPKGE